MHAFHCEFQVTLSFTLVIASQLIKPLLLHFIGGDSVSVDFIFYDYARIKGK
jgi:hypothetical protein